MVASAAAVKPATVYEGLPMMATSAVVAERVEVALFVFTAELRGARQQLVLDRHSGPAAQLRVERAQQRVLAARGGGEIGCAIDDAIVGDEHAVTVCEPADTRCEMEFPVAKGQA